MLTFPTDATLWAPAFEGMCPRPSAPEVTLFKKSTDSTVPALRPSDPAWAMSPSVPEMAGSTASGACPVEPSGVPAYAP